MNARSLASRTLLTAIGVAAVAMCPGALTAVAQLTDFETLRKATELYDERGYSSAKAITVDGSLVIGNANGNVSYVYPISTMNVNGAAIATKLSYCGSVAFTAFTEVLSVSGGQMGPYSWETFHQNRPAWIVGVNDFAVQVISVTGGTFYSHQGKVNSPEPDTTHLALDDSDFNWVIDGYDFSNRMAHFNSEFPNIDYYVDRIRLLRADGGILTLTKATDRNTEGCSELFNCEKLYTGRYAPLEANAKGYGVVEYDTAQGWPAFMRGRDEFSAESWPRKLRYYPGDGLEYVFRERVAPYGMYSIMTTAPVYGSTTIGPTIFYLEEIRNGAGIVTSFIRGRHYPGHIAAIPNSIIPDFLLDTTRGRANIVSYFGHQFAVGNDAMFIEALGRTTIVRYALVNRSGEAGPSEPMPLGEFGVWNRATQQLARIPDIYPQICKSWVGYVTEIIDPEHRSTTFAYEPYTVGYEDFAVPYDRDGQLQTVSLRNYRLKEIVEPTAKYSICYVPEGGLLNQCADTSPPLDRMEPTSLDPYQTSNWAYKVEKFAPDNELLKTETYDYSLAVVPGTKTSVTMRDEVTGKERVTIYDYVHHDLGEIIPGYPGPRFTELRSVFDTADGWSEYRETIYGRSDTTSYQWLPTSEIFKVNGREKYRREFGYEHELVRDYDSDLPFDAMLGWEAKRRFGRLAAGGRTVTYDTVEYLNLPLIDSLSWVEKRWLKFRSLDTFRYYYSDLQDARLRGRLDSLWSYWQRRPPIGQFDSITMSADFSAPPIFGLVRREWTSDSLGRYLGGAVNVYIDTVPTPLFTGVRGNLVADSVIGRARSATVLNKRLEYSSGWNRNHPVATWNANGAVARQSIVSYDCLKGVNGQDSCVEVVGQGKHLDYIGTAIERPVDLSSMFAEYFSEPTLRRRDVRRYAGGSLDTVALRSHREITFYGLERGTLEPNGYYSRFDYDTNGRVRHVWLPKDFPLNTDPLDTTAYEGTYGVRLVAATRYERRRDTLDCRGYLDTGVVITGDLVTDVYSDIFKAELPVTLKPKCPCDTSGYDAVAQKTGGSLMETCLSDKGFIGHNGASGYEAWLDYKRDSLDLMSAATRLDSLWLKVVIKSMRGECIVLDVENQEFSYKQTYVFNCGETPGQDTLEGGGIFFYVNLTPIRNAIKALAHDRVTRCTLRVASVGHEMVFSDGSDGEDIAPEFIMKGRFRYMPDYQDNTVAYAYDDEARTVTVEAKVDDLYNTSSAFGGGSSQTMETRRSEVMHSLGVDGKVLTTTRTIGNPQSPIRTDSVRYAYTGLGAVKKRIDESAYDVQTVYDGFGRVTEVENEDGTTKTVSYAAGQPSTFGLNDQSYFGFCLVTTSTNENGNLSKRFQDAFDRLRREEVSPDGTTIYATEYEYDEIGRLTSVRDPEGKTTRYWYDALGRIQYKYHPDFDTLSYAYDAVGNARFTQSQDQANNSLLTFTEYDDLNRVTVIGEAKIATGGQQTGRAMGDKRGGGLQGAATDTLDLNRWTDRIDPTSLADGGQSAILTANKTLWMTSQQSVPGMFSYDSVGLEMSNCEFPAPSSLLGETEPPMPPFIKHTVGYYDPKQTPAAFLSEFEDLAKYPNFIRIVVNYDSLPPRLGPVWGAFPSYAEWDSIAPTKRIRNIKGREVAVAYREHGGHPFHFVVLSYDERGRVEALLRYTENLGFDAVYYAYNSSNQVVEVRSADPLNQHSTWYGYNYNGQVDSVWTKLTMNAGLGLGAATYPVSHTLPRMSPDIVYRYTPRAQVDVMDYPPITGAVNYDYNARGWLDSIDASSLDNGGQTVSALFKEVLTYDPTGQITKQVWQHRGGATQEQNYSYDSLSRLIAWTDGGDTVTYAYDEVGNRLNSAKFQPGFGITYYADNYAYELPTQHPDRLLQRERIDQTHYRWTDYTYDADGAVTGRSKKDSMIAPPFTVNTYPTETFYYSWRDLMWRYTYNGSTHDWRYRYSAAGEREQKRLYPVDTSSLASADDNPWVYYLLGGGKEQLAVWHGRENHLSSCPNMEIGKVYLYPVEYNTFGGSMSRISTRPIGGPNGIKTFRIADHLGSNRVYIDTVLTTKTADYEPFGKAIAGVPTDMRQNYIDKEKDFENGLGDFGVRKYEEETGRFMSVDPLWEKYLSISPYAYGGNSPIGIKDPSGLEGEDVSQRGPRRGFVRRGRGARRGSEESAREYRERTAREGLREVRGPEPEVHRQKRETSSAQDRLRRNPNEQMERNSGEPVERTIGTNPRYSNRFVNTDQEGGREAAMDLFVRLTRNHAVEHLSSRDGSSRLRSEQGIQMRMKADGTTVIEVPRSDGKAEKIHFGK